MNHLVLLGDSIFDNGVYVPGEPDVIHQVRAKLPEGWQASLRAVDGDRVGDITTQLTSLPSDATHIALSVGGNDALDQAGILQEPARSFAEVLERLAQVGDPFRNAYHAMLQQVLERGLPTMVCTIYEGNMPDPRQQRLVTTALKIFNDAILREAFAAGVPVLDLRAVCSRPEDYANPIEPSFIGGNKIATGIARIITTHDFSGGCRQIYTK
ncbi:MAG TPA: SGNH/GDSL hydrolase family protein [Abditibacteriaceae bacterium]|jgi:lysophospholipase L1-like esterase